MASEIKVDTIVNAGGDNDTGIDLATNDQILLKVANATKLTMNSTGQTTIVGEGGTTTTSVQQGLAKAWVKFQGTSTATINDSFNITGITDQGTGQFQFEITNDMNSVHFSTTSSLGNNDSSNAGINRNEMTGSNNAGTFHFESTSAGGTSDPNADVAGCSATVHGDLA